MIDVTLLMIAHFFPDGGLPICCRHCEHGAQPRFRRIANGVSYCSCVVALGSRLNQVHQRTMVAMATAAKLVASLS
jgi:hypothetical protein